MTNRRRLSWFLFVLRKTLFIHWFRSLTKIRPDCYLVRLGVWGFAHMSNFTIFGRGHNTAVSSAGSGHDQRFPSVGFLLFTILRGKWKMLNSHLDAMEGTKMASSIFFCTFLKDDVILYAMWGKKSKTNKTERQCSNNGLCRCYVIVLLGGDSITLLFSYDFSVVSIERLRIIDG